jgi:hypothetical protein
MGSFIRLQGHPELNQFSIPINSSLSVGSPDNRFMFGGVSVRRT